LFIQSVGFGRIDGSEERNITLKLRGREVGFMGQPYLLYFVLPNFYFHITAAYAILRHNGLAIGKWTLSETTERESELDQAAFAKQEALPKIRSGTFGKASCLGCLALRRY
jgi:hypothetical protein